MAAVTSVGTPTLTRAAAGSVTATWGASQNRAAGNLLVAAVSATAATSVTAPSTPAGWAKIASNTANSQCAACIYTKVAAGSDAAPAFTSTLTGTGAMTATLFELSGDVGPVSLQTNGGNSGTTTVTLNLTTPGKVLLSGEFAVAITAQLLASAGTDTVTPAGGWTGAGDDHATSDVTHAAVITQASPAVGSTLTGSVTWGTAGTEISGVIAVFQTPLQAFPLAPQPGWAPAIGARFGPARPFDAGALLPAPTAGTPVTVTATQGGSTANGLLLRVMVLTQAAAGQPGVTGTAAAGAVTVTTTQTGSECYGASIRAAATANSPVAGCSTLDDVQDATHGTDYSTWKTTSLTGTPGSTAVGMSAGVGVAAAEILTAGTLTEDGSAPPGVSTTAATTVSTASFVPPANSLLVALVSSDGAGSVTTMTVSDGTLTWTEQVHQNPAGSGYCGVWTAPVTAGGGTTATAGAAASTVIAPAAQAAVTATAGAAASTAAAPAATAAIVATAGVAAISAVAPAATVADTATAAVATVSAVAPAASTALTVTAGVAAVSAVAPAPTVAVTVTAGVGIVGAVAPAATVNTSGSTNAPAAVATVSATAPAPVVALAVNAGVATVAALAPAPTLALTIPAGVARVLTTAPAATGHTGSAIVKAFSTSAVSDPRDGTPSVGATTTSAPQVHGD